MPWKTIRELAADYERSLEQINKRRAALISEMNKTDSAEQKRKLRQRIVLLERMRYDVAFALYVMRGYGGKHDE